MRRINKLKQSFWLFVYLGLSRGNPLRMTAAVNTRPDGDLVWFHLPKLERLPASCYFIERLCALRPEVKVLVTTVVKTRPNRLNDDILWAPIASEHPAAIESFLSHWQPDLCLWSYGNLRPALLHRAAKKNIPLYLLDVEERSFPKRRWRWLNSLRKSILDQFQEIFATSSKASLTLIQNGAPAAIVQTLGGLQNGKLPLTCDPKILNSLAQGLRSRPLWLAAGVLKADVHSLIMGQTNALRSAHRLLLVIVPDRIQDATAIQQQAVEMGLKVGLWQGDAVPGDNVQMLVVPDKRDLALWYRLCPISFLGGTLQPEGSAPDPYDAVALGSAVVHGPHVFPHAESFAGLSEAGAALKVETAAQIGTVIMSLNASEHCAKMTVAGWAVLTAGAKFCDHLVDLVNDRLERPKGA